MRALDGEMLPLMVFALIFGVAVSRTAPRDDQRNVLMRFLEQVFDACMQIVHFAMKLAPFAVFAIIFNTAFTFGTAVFATLFFYVATVVAAPAAAPVRGLLRAAAAGGAAVAASSSSASAATSTSTRSRPRRRTRRCRSRWRLPRTKLRLPPDIARFVLTVGATANQNGTALFEGVTVLFLAQVYGLDLTLGQQVRVMLMSILAGIGTAGVPGGSLPMVMIVAQSVGIPAEGMGLILGVDRFLDMCRTTVNVSGDLVIAALVSGPGSRRSEAVRQEETQS